MNKIKYRVKRDKYSNIIVKNIGYDKKFIKWTTNLQRRGLAVLLLISLSWFTTYQHISIIKILKNNFKKINTDQRTSKSMQFIEKLDV